MLAGVSHQTVSRYLKGGSSLRPATAERVAKALSQLNYSPNLAARALRSREPYTIYFIVPEPSIQVPPRMLNSAKAAAQANGYRVEIVILDPYKENRESQFHRLFSLDDVAGVLSFAPLPRSISDRSFAQPPLVVAGDCDDNLRLPGTLVDGAPVAAIVRHLASLGHSNFVHVAGPTDWTAARSRAAVFSQTIIELGLTSHGIEAGDWSVASGYTAGQRIAVHKHVTAVVAANDQMAIGVIRALHDSRLKVPDDVSVIGWGDVEESSFLVPSLSTVRMDLEALGARSMMKLIGRTRNAPGPELPALADSRILLRESVGPARKRAPQVA
ncbi:LacI family transcriptional regulator [Arthrobacter sp. StoSoilA2]|nr:LacI family transcriptional regulator [Arthrobacter sp. StoSoilA2]